MFKTILALFLISSSAGFATVSNGDKAQFFGANILRNPGFEEGTVGWTSSGPAINRTCVTGNGKATNSEGQCYGRWDSTAAGQTLTGSLLSVAGTNPAFQNTEIAVKCYVRCASGTCTHKMQIWDGASAIAESPVNTSTTQWLPITLTAYNGAGSPVPRFISVASNEPEIQPDMCVVSRADQLNLSLVSQAKLATSVKFEYANCQSWTRTNTAFGAFTADTDCNAPQVVEAGFLAVDTTDTDKPIVTLLNAPAGTYIVQGIASTVISSPEASAKLAWSDGTNVRGHTQNTQTSTNENEQTVVGTFSYTTSGSRSFELFGAATAGNILVRGDLNTVTAPLHVLIQYYPPATEQALRFDQVAWHVDANIAGADIALSGANQSAYIEMTDAGLTLTNNNTPGSISAQIACASGTASTGTTCSVNESNGIAFVAPSAGAAKACASFGHLVGVTAGTVDAAFQIVKTTNTSSAIVTESNGRMPSRIGGTMTNTNSIELCGTVNLDAGLNTLRVEYEQDLSGVVGTNVVRASAAAPTGQADIHWTVMPINQPVPAPLLMGTVASSGTGQVRHEVASVANNGTATIVSQIGSWLASVNRSSAGVVTATFAASAFSSTPYCFCQSNAGNGEIFATNSASSSSVVCSNSGAATDRPFNLLCTGSH